VESLLDLASKQAPVPVAVSVELAQTWDKASTQVPEPVAVSEQRAPEWVEEELGVA
jgi:hypothetical protein